MPPPDCGAGARFPVLVVIKNSLKWQFKCPEIPHQVKLATGENTNSLPGRRRSNMKLHLFHFLRIIILLLLLLPNFSFTQEDGDDVVIGKYRKFYSKILGEDFTFLEHLPSNYEKCNKKYPVVYLLSGQYISSFANASLTLDRLGYERIPQMILIGVSNTGRAHKCTPCVQGNPEDADLFINFLDQELIPFINKNYRVENYRVLMGQSYTGLAALYTFITKPDLFNAYIPSSPALWYCPDYLKKKMEHFLQNDTLKNRFLYISYGENDYNELLDVIPMFKNIFQTNASDNLQWNFNLIENDGHVPFFSLNNGLKALFPDFKIPENLKEEGLETIIKYYQNQTIKYGFKIDPPEEILFDVAFQRKQKNQLEESITIFKTIIEIYPNTARSYCLLGECYLDMGNEESANKYIKKSLEVNPNYSRAKRVLEELNKDH
jgi:predicted alpha/beta superfamily hydrolase